MISMTEKEKFSAGVVWWCMVGCAIIVAIAMLTA